MKWYDANFAYKKALVIPHGQVSGSSDLRDFPLLVSITDTSLKSAASYGGLMTSSSGYDMLFTDASETRELPYELESYTASSGALLCWVRIPVLSASFDTTIYLYFGNGSVASSLGSPSEVWDSHYSGVYHLSDDSGYASGVDSTSNGNSGASLVLATGGQIAGGGSIPGFGVVSISNASDLQFISGDSITVSGWGQRAATGSQMTIIAHDGGGIGEKDFALGFDSGNHVAFWYINGSGTTQRYATTATHTDLFWHYYCATYTYGTATSATLYMDGSPVSASWTSGTGTSAPATDILPVCVGGDGTSSADYFNGVLDEIRLSKEVIRTASWIATEYANQSNPSSFFLVGQTIPFIGPLQESLLVVTSQTTTQTSSDQINPNARGILLYVNASILGASETLTVNVQGKDIISGSYYTVASFSGVGLSTTLLTLYPTIASSSVAVCTVLPRTWRVQVVPSTGDTATYTVSGSLLK